MLQVDLNGPFTNFIVDVILAHRNSPLTNTANLRTGEI